MRSIGAGFECEHGRFGNRTATARRIDQPWVVCSDVPFVVMKVSAQISESGISSALKSDLFANVSVLICPFDRVGCGLVYPFLRLLVHGLA